MLKFFYVERNTLHQDLNIKYEYYKNRYKYSILFHFLWGIEKILRVTHHELDCSFHGYDIVFSGWTMKIKASYSSKTPIFIGQNTRCQLMQEIHRH